MIKVRTATRPFTDTFGNLIAAGEPYVLIELRPLFVGRQTLAQTHEELAHAPQPKPEPKQATEGRQ